MTAPVSPHFRTTPTWIHTNLIDEKNSISMWLELTVYSSVEDQRQRETDRQGECVQSKMSTLQPPPSRSCPSHRRHNSILQHTVLLCQKAEVPTESSVVETGIQLVVASSGKDSQWTQRLNKDPKDRDLSLNISLFVM